jgi:hypothetical protein
LNLRDLIGKSTRKAVQIRLNISSGEISIPAELRGFECEMSRYTLSETIIIRANIRSVKVDDFRSCSNLRKVVVAADRELREIHGFRNYLKLEVIDIDSSSINVIAQSAFRNEDSTAPTRVLIVDRNQALLRRNRRQCHIEEETMNTGSRTVLMDTQIE